MALRDGVRLWHHTAEAELTMRNFSDGFLDQYLARVGSRRAGIRRRLSARGRGRAAFTSVEGDYFTVLGLPLLPLLGFLRAQGELAS